MQFWGSQLQIFGDVTNRFRTGSLMCSLIIFRALQNLAKQLNQYIESPQHLYVQSQQYSYLQLISRSLLNKAHHIIYNIINNIKILIMAYERTPADFMKGVFISPHSFSDPEHPQHGNYVNDQMKNDLYNQSLYKITGCEFSFLGNKEQELSVEKISKCQGADPLGGLSAKIMKFQKPNQSQLISCEDWTVARRVGPTLLKQQISKYRVKIYQSKTDIFYSQIHPPSLWKLFKFYTFN